MPGTPGSMNRSSAKGKPDRPRPGRLAAVEGRSLGRPARVSFRTFPDRIPAAEPRPGAGWARTRGGWPPNRGSRWQSSISRRGGDAAGRGTLIVLNEDESLGPVPAWAGPIVGDDAVVVLAARGVGPTAWDRKSPPNYVARAHAASGSDGRCRAGSGTPRRLLAGWRSTRARDENGGSREAGRPPSSPPTRRFSSRPWPRWWPSSPPASHREGPIFLGVLQVLDVPTALGLLAPRPLTLVGTKGDAWDLTRTLYQRAGASQ